MIKKVQVIENIKAQDFLRYATPLQRKQIHSLAKQLKGKKILHINATAVGGGVAEILQSFISWLNSLDIEAAWYAIDPLKVEPAYFVFTKRLHNALQGARIKFSKKDWEMYENVNRKIAASLNKIDYDVLIIHDPQPLAVIHFLEKKKPTAVVIHIDTSASFSPVWRKIALFIGQYDQVVFSNKDFVHKSLPFSKLNIFPPAIDPISLKQTIVSSKKARAYLTAYGIPSKGLLVVQVSRFDVWKNPIGVVEAFRLIKDRHPGGSLALVGLKEAKDDPEGEIVYKKVKTAVGKDPQIFLFFEPQGIKSIAEFTMMAQNAADVIIQNSVKEGFGLVITEAMWKAKPVIGGSASGVRRQITNGKNGYIVKNSKELARRLDYLLSHPGKRKTIGRAAKQSVAENFLMTRLLRDHLQLYKKLL
ncbi:glycosyltransferase [Patescibacteria group bacterium]|nr:glycosyltransferase [Patescibacteria group bacterium]